MTDDRPFDDERLPHELRRALWKADYATPQMEPGLNLVPVDEHGMCAVIDCHGTRVGEIPLYRLKALTPAAVEVLFDAAVEAGADRDAVEVDDPPDSDMVAARWGSMCIRWHRCLLVEGWPDDDVDVEERVYPFEHG